MTLMELVKSTYLKIRNAEDENDVIVIISSGITKAQRNRIPLESFINRLDEKLSFLTEAQENSKTLKNLKKAREIIKRYKR